ncbi:hypothetical protein CHS0354_042762 [Potamilus streckersoni]|uniref:non-specific serine/threonine protein kinase n=1 Tax=Potamilus streckersoni TaxID=2493646 RepID=A0AAE0S9B6_9BIVA|nr:hypothetical protein CHS0354_042762 [Potamilus streckersoni]
MGAAILTYHVENLSQAQRLIFGVDIIRDGETVDKSTHRLSGQKSSTSRPRMQTTLDDYEVIETIGTGSYGTCKKIRRRRDGLILVWKEMDYGMMTETEKQMLVSEVNLLRELKSPYIVRYYDRIIDRTNTTIFIIMEYCKGGDLATLINKCKKEGSYLDENFIWKILIQVTLALKECHERKNGKAVLHRDLKPANVFLDTDKNVKLGDFGLARVLHHETSFANTFVGTPFYMSPELVNNMSYNEKSDVWSMGCMLYELCALRPPFVASNQAELNRKIRLGEFARIPLHFSDDLNTIQKKMLQVDVSKRPSITELLAEPLVASRLPKVEKKRQGHSSHQTSDEFKTFEAELKALERELEAKKQELEYREKQIADKEALLKDREKAVAVKEKLAEERFAIADSLLKEYERRSHTDTERLLQGDIRETLVTPVTPVAANLTDSSPEGLQPCLMRGKKDSDTPKKKVSFDMYGKENLRNRPKSADFTSNYSEYDSLYLQELAKRRELKDRLYHAKARALEIRVSDPDVRHRSRNLLHFR